MNNLIELELYKKFNSNEMKISSIIMIFEMEHLLFKYKINIFNSSNGLECIIFGMKKFLISIQNDRKIKSEFIFDISGDTIYSIIFNNDTYNFILKRICGKELINFTIKKNLMVYFDNLIYHLENLNMLEKIEKKDKNLYTYTII